MSSQQFQAAHDKIYSTGTRLLQYLQEVRKGRCNEGNDSEGLLSLENKLNAGLEALQGQKYQVAVIAAMKAGKSTFLNAIIGSDILASEAAACTVCRREKKEKDPDLVLANLKIQKAALHEYLRELSSVGELLDSWKPAQAVR